MVDGLNRVVVSIRHKRTSRTLAGPCRAWRRPRRPASAPPAAAAAGSTWRYGRRRPASPRAHSTALTRRLHMVTHHTQNSPGLQRRLRSEDQRARRDTARLRRVADSAARRAGAVTGATFASARSHPVTRLTRREETIATQPTTRRTIGVCDDMQRQRLLTS